MSIKRNIRLLTLVSTLAAGGLAVGCGGSTNNDQGTSFLAFQYFQDIGRTVQVQGYNAFLALDSNTTPASPSSPTQIPPTTGVPFSGRQERLFMGVQNRMSSQYVRVTRVDCDYIVPGSDPGFVI